MKQVNFLAFVSSLKKENVVLCILLLGLLLRLPNVKLPLVDANAWRQTDTASIARNFYEQRFNIFYPQVDWRGASDGYVEAEFQIYPYLVASLYKIFGVHEWLGRLVSLIFFIISTIFLYALVKKIYNEKVALWSILFFMISPLNIHFSRAFMPSSMLVFCSIASIYFFFEWLEKEKWYYFAISALATSLAILIKLPLLFLGLPLIYLALKKFKKHILLQGRIWLFGLSVLIPVFLWYYHAHRLFLKTHLTFGLWGEGYSKFGHWTYWLNLNFYKTIISRMAFDILPVLGLAVALLGFLLKTEKKNYIFHWWGAAFLLYILIAAEGHQTHLYYQLPLVPVFCVYAALGMNYLWGKEFFKDSFLQNHLNPRTAIIALFVIMAIAGILRTKQYFRLIPERIEFGKRIEQLTEKDSLIIIGGWSKARNLRVKYPPRDPIDFYFSHRKGWEIDRDDWSISLIDSLLKQGARYFATFYPMEIERNRAFALAMRKKYKIIEATARWIIYELE